MNPQVLNQSPDLEHRAPHHAKKRILNLNKGKPKETETEEGSTGPRPLVKNLKYPQGDPGLGRAVDETQACPTHPLRLPGRACGRAAGGGPAALTPQAAGSVRLASRCPWPDTGLGAWLSQLKSPKARIGLIPPVGGGGGGGQSGPSSSANPGFQARFQRHHQP